MAGLQSIVRMCALLGTALLATEYDLSSAFAAKHQPAKDLFSSREVPAELNARAIGFYTRGCLAGAVEMSEDGPYWQAVRLSRNRNWGHPVLVNYLEKLAEAAATKDGWNGLIVGDMSQPRGGPMSAGHASHQVGLDADVWLRPMPERRLSRQEREEISAISMLKDDTLFVDDAVWTDGQFRLLKRAASYDEVARIFVHPGIKRKLCDTAGDDRGFLRKIRPWYGHYYHFHVRLKCPSGSAGCEDQAAPPPGDGCGAPLDYWFTDAPWKPAKPRDPKAKPVTPRYTQLGDLPKSCAAVLDAPGPGGVTVRRLALSWPPYPWNNAPPPKARPAR